MTHIHRFVRAGFALLLLCLAQPAAAQIRTLKGTVLSGKDIDAFVRRQMDSLKIPALSIAIIQSGRMMYYKATGVKNDRGEPVDSNTLFEAASMTKPVFAYAVHRLVQQGRISLDTPLCRYYPYDDIEYDDRYKRITARMVLSHTTGFPNWRGGGGSPLTIGFEPGSKYGYSGEGYEYLGLVVRHLLNKKVQEVVEQEVFRPLLINNAFLVTNQYVQDHLADGLRDNTEWGWNNPFLRPNVAYSLYTEAREYAKFVMGLMRENRSSTGVFAQMASPQAQADSNKWACLGVFMEPTPYGPKYSHSGNNNNRYNSNFEFYGERDLGYVFFMNCHQEPEFTRRLNRFLEQGG